MRSESSRIFKVKPSRKDPRDFRYYDRAGLTYGASLNIPATFLPKRLPFVYDQLQFGTCGGHAGAEAVDYHFPGIMAARLYAYTAAKQIEQNVDEGVEPVSIAQVLVKRGVCLEELCDYSKLVDVHQLPTLTPEMDADAANRKGTEYSQLLTVDDIKHNIASGNGTLLAILVFEDFETSIGGFIPKKPQGNMLGGHLIYADGYDDTLTHTYPDGSVETGFVRCINSWSKAWGDEGYLYLPYSFFTYQTPDPYAPIHQFIEGWSVVYPTKVTPVQEDVIKIQLGNTVANVNGMGEDMGVAPLIANDHVLIPLRFIGEFFGANVSWDQTTQTATIRKEKI